MNTSPDLYWQSGQVSPDLHSVLRGATPRATEGGTFQI